MVSVAAIQMVSSDQVEQNLRDTELLVTQAAEQGAQLVVLPENFALLSSSKSRETGMKETTPDGPVRSFVADLARRRQLWIVAGSIPITVRPDGAAMESRVRAACFVYDSQGNEVARYDKIHLFDVDVADDFGSYRESDTIEPGDAVRTVATPFGCLGLSICYDLRFPELYRQLLQRGAEIITVPSAFTAVTGAAHWEVLLRARAVENLCYVIGANQGGRHSKTRETYGHSMVVDPWGRMLASREKGPGVVMASLDRGYLEELRQRMPVIKHRRL